MCGLTPRDESGRSTMAASPRIEFGTQEPALAARRVLRERNRPSRRQLVQRVRGQSQIRRRLMCGHPAIRLDDVHREPLEYKLGNAFNDPLDEISRQLDKQTLCARQ